MHCEAMRLKHFLVSGLGLWMMAAALAPAQAAPVEIQMPTRKGFVAFTVEGQWPVLALQPRYPVASAAYRIPHAADGDTPDSSNVVIAFYDSDSAEGRSAFATPPRQYGATAPVKETQHGWTIYRQLGQQGDTPYTIVDAKHARLAGVGVSVRMVWPQRSDYPADFDARMDRVFQEVLQSVHAGKRPVRR